MRDTEFVNDKGETIKQKLINRNTGIIKGAQQVGYERGLWDKEGKVVDDSSDSDSASSKSKKKRKTMRTVNLSEMRQILSEETDFRLEPLLLQVLHNKLAKQHASDLVNPCQGETNPCVDMIYAPKFHVELQEKIERAWAHSKAGCCRDRTFSITGKHILIQGCMPLGCAVTSFHMLATKSLTTAAVSVNF